ncbi:hypothetical protein Lgra_0521 [Legionella gratiana]|uniref:Uncharacterized protein n=1 Tax=Legionella gratiana TaxID=45066 RepID=A0A378J2Q0_9GAMM|nr:hypothetical protein [Legionella gratiana]KTD14490.1 hypothetical protein Lgra_0521 [Legionella gratiana]STX42024.1 Uncharacterised protein [Legionella gratiana]
MKLKLTTFSEEHKNILRAQRTSVINTLDEIAAYLVENGDAEPEWRTMLNKEYMINYYDVIPDKGRLRAHEIDLELPVTHENGYIAIKIFKKDVQKANEALIRVVYLKLEERKVRLMHMAQDTTGDHLELINAHITHTESLMKKCVNLKLSSQLLIAEVGGLHFVEQILNQVKDSLNSLTHEHYIQFKEYMYELKRLIQLHSPVMEPGYDLFYSRRDIIDQRQRFNKIFNICKSLLFSFSQEGLLDSNKEQLIIKSFNHLQHLFFAKCDVNFMALM